MSEAEKLPTLFRTDTGAKENLIALLQDAARTKAERDAFEIRMRRAERRLSELHVTYRQVRCGHGDQFVEPVSGAFERDAKNYPGPKAKP